MPGTIEVDSPAAHQMATRNILYEHGQALEHFCGDQWESIETANKFNGCQTTELSDDAGLLKY